MNNSDNSANDDINQRADESLVENQIRETQEFLQNSNKMINEALANCDMQPFTPVEISFPQFISDTSLAPPKAPEVHNFFNQAESIWQNLLHSSEEAEAPSDIDDMFASNESDTTE